jgi:hypothetical protein
MSSRIQWYIRFVDKVTIWRNVCSWSQTGEVGLSWAKIGGAKLATLFFTYSLSKHILSTFKMLTHHFLNSLCRFTKMIRTSERKTVVANLAPPNFGQFSPTFFWKIITIFELTFNSIKLVLNMSFLCRNNHKYIKKEILFILNINKMHKCDLLLRKMGVANLAPWGGQLSPTIFEIFDFEVVAFQAT